MISSILLKADGSNDKSLNYPSFKDLFPYLTIYSLLINLSSIIILKILFNEVLVNEVTNTFIPIFLNICINYKIRKVLPVPGYPSTKEKSFINNAFLMAYFCYGL